MAEVDYLHVCEYAFPGLDGKVGIIGIFKNIRAAAFPATQALMFIAIQFQGTAHEVIPFRMELGRPNGDVIGHIESTGTVGDEGMGFVALQLINTVFPEAGRYTVKVLSAGRTLATESIRLHQLPQPGAPPAPTERRH